MWADPNSAPTQQQTQAEGSFADFSPEDVDVERQFDPSLASASARTTSLDSRTPLRLLRPDLPSQLATRYDRLRNPRETRGIGGPRESSISMTSPRMDLAARNSLREMILSAVLSEVPSPLERVALLEDCRASAEASNLGIPFRDILSEPMEPLGVSALMYELIGCQPDWDGINDDELGTGLEMVLYLLEHWSGNVLVHGKMGVRRNVVRTACLRRSDESEGNRLFQYLRPIASKGKSGEGNRYFEYDISVSPLGAGMPGGVVPGAQPKLDFTALISLPHFASSLAQAQNATITLESPTSTGWKPPPPVAASTYVTIEFLAARRAWRLKVDSNMLKLELLDGPVEESALITDARVKIIVPERDQQGQSSSTSSASRASGSACDFEHGTPIELLLPRALLRPITATGPGTTEVTLSPCFCAGLGDYNALRGLDDTRLLHDSQGTLLLELSVRFARDPLSFTLVEVPRVPSQDLESTSQAGPSQSGQANQSNFENDDLYAASDLESELILGARLYESEWEEVSQIDETEGGWVKASWSGKDEDL